MVTDFPIQGILEHLVKRIVDVLPITAAGVTLISKDLRPRYVAASDEAALRYEKLQSELGEGPCLAAYHTRESVSLADLTSDSRFPKFTPRARSAGLGAVFTFPLRSGEYCLGALDLYRQTAGPMDAASMSASQTLADVTTAYLLNAQGRADLLESEERFRESALHDPLTGLPNRVLLMERLDHAVRRAHRSGQMAAVLYFDLDGFKAVNDTYGHQVGDEMLVSVAKRLSSGLRSGDTLARLSGDEFVILCEDIDGPAHANTIATRLGTAVRMPFLLAGSRLKMSASVGIAFAGPGDQLSERLLDDADAAMYQAKRTGGGHHEVVDLRSQHVASQRTTLARELHGAVKRGELRNAYQPIVETADGRIIGAEALVRWVHPFRGLVAPTLLVPVAERSDLINEIGSWVLERACADRHRQVSPGDDHFSMSVNISGQQLMAPDFPRDVAAVLTRTETDPELMTLEVTERAFLQDGERALVTLRKLKHLGVKLALDDFGTGFSSLNHLTRFPVDSVKIDRSFVAKMDEDEATQRDDLGSRRTGSQARDDRRR